MTTAPPPPCPGDCPEDFDFVSAGPHSSNHTVGTASWQNHDSSPPQSIIILHCHGCPCLSTTYISSALWRQCKSKITAHLNDWCIIYSLWCTSHENLVFSHPPKYIDPKYKIWHPLIYFSSYFQVHSHPITSFSFWHQLLKSWSSLFYWMSLFSLG